jgi:hypothetical protein
VRFRPALLCLASALAVSPCAFAQYSFGPEISAEDFSQHLQGLAVAEPAGHQFNDYAEALRLSYLRYQFTRLGLPTGPNRCGDGRGLQAELEGTEKGRAPVVYYAPWTDAAQVAGVLEIAERFMTSRPRPEHTVMFVFGSESHSAPGACRDMDKTARVIQPENLPTGDATALVQQLIALQRQGR